MDRALPWLVADIGGTNARFGWVEAAGGGVQQVRTLAVNAHATPEDAVRAYLAGLGAAAPPRRAAFAVATPVIGDEVRFTNSPWRFSCAALQARLGLQELRVLNDFEALALALPGLRPAQSRPIGTPRPSTEAATTIAVIGPGTGLGVGAVTRGAGGEWMAIAGEGGHATLAAGDAFEDRLLQRIRLSHPHVSAERLLSGVGLPTLHAAVAAELGVADDGPDAAAVIERALRGDATCGRTVDTFCALLGSFAGNVALILGARGGVYIGGGIVPRLGERFFTSAFRARFEAKGRMQPLLAAVPTALITDTLVALQGSAFALEQSARP